MCLLLLFGLPVQLDDLAFACEFVRFVLTVWLINCLLIDLILWIPVLLFGRIFEELIVPRLLILEPEGLCLM